MTVNPDDGEASAVKSGQQHPRPKLVSQWTVADVQKWFSLRCGDYYHLYAEKLLEHDITGESFPGARVLARLNDVVIF